VIKSSRYVHRGCIPHPSPSFPKFAKGTQLFKALTASDSAPKFRNIFWNPCVPPEGEDILSHSLCLCLSCGTDLPQYFYWASPQKSLYTYVPGLHRAVQWHTRNINKWHSLNIHELADMLSGVAANLPIIVGSRLCLFRPEASM